MTPPEGSRAQTREHVDYADWRHGIPGQYEHQVGSDDMIFDS